MEVIMMKNRISITLAAVGFCVLLSACSKAPANSSDIRQDAAGSTYTENTETETADAETESAVTEETGSIDNTESTESDTPVTSGGRPWIDSDLKENLTENMKTDPRDDFHLYANKDWLLENEIPDGHESWSFFTERGFDVDKQCMELLKDESIEGHDGELVRTLNSLLLDWDERGRNGISDLEELYSELLRVRTIEDVDQLLEERSNIILLSQLVAMKSSIGYNDPEHYVAVIDTPSLILNDSAEYRERSAYGDACYKLYKDTFIYLAGKFGMSENEAEKCFEDAIGFETLLADHIYTTQEKNSDEYYEKTNNEMTLDELTDLCRNYPLGRILDTAGYSYDGIYQVYNPGYLIRLDEVYTDENIEGIRARLIVKYLLAYIEWLDKDTYDLFQDMITRYFGTSGRLTDEEMAYDWVHKLLPQSMQKVYVEKYGSEEDREKIRSLFREIKDTYREMLLENDWATEELKEAAVRKLDHLTLNALYPDKFRDTSAIDLKGCSLIEAGQKIKEYEFDYNISLLGTARDQEMWALTDELSILLCNADYEPALNTMFMFIGMMGEPFYSPDMSTEEFYATIGTVMGHEISHAFDNNGSQFDENGAMNNWWSKEDAAEFQKRIDKMKDHLDGIVAFGEEHFIGESIAGEMVADMTGVQCILRMASKIKDFDYDRFFVKYAQVNRHLSLYSTEYWILTQDVHPLDYSRTNVPLQQFEEFYETYGVKEGDNMYLAPEDRLIVW